MTSSTIDGEGVPSTNWRAIIVRWVIAFGALCVATLAMYLVRGALDKAHVALMYLLIVLGASASGGRALGLSVAALGFLFFDLFFLPPYNTLALANPLDWLVLFAFLITSVVATQLLYRANATAQTATQRAIEVDRLAALGAETLNAADAYDALRAIADVIRSALDGAECDIYLRELDGRMVLAAHSERGAAGEPVDFAPGSQTIAEPHRAQRRAVTPGSLVDWIVEHGASAVELTDGTVRVAHELPPLGAPASGQLWEAQSETVAAVRAVTRLEDSSTAARVRGMFVGSEESARRATHRPAVRAVALPLQVRDHTVGVLRLSGTDALTLTPEQARLLIALAYYAALGAERARLVATAERASATRSTRRLA